MPEKQYVHSGAFMLCDKCVAPVPVPLTVTSQVTISLPGGFMATDLDNLFPLNVPPFGVCAVTHAPCVFQDNGDGWNPVQTDVEVGPRAGLALREDSQIMCVQGGKIRLFLTKAAAMATLPEAVTRAFDSAYAYLEGVGPPFGGLLRDELAQAKGTWQGVRDMAVGLWDLAQLVEKGKQKVGESLVFAVTHPAEAAQAVGAAANTGWKAVSDGDNWLAAGKASLFLNPATAVAATGAWLSDPDNQAKVGEAFKVAKDWEANLTDYERKTLLGRAKFEVAMLFIPVSKASAAAKAAELAKGGEAAADGMRLLGEVKTGAKGAEAAGEVGKVEELFAGLKKCFTEGHPVDVASGLLFTQATDFALPGPLPLVWTRTWLSTFTHCGALGHGWHHEYDLGLTPAPNGGATLRRADGRQVVFDPPAAPTERSFNRRHQLELAPAATAGAPPRIWDVAQNCWYVFEAADSAPPATPTATPPTPPELRLQAVEDANGCAIRFAYSPAGHLAAITDSAGRVLPCDTDAAGRLLAIHAPDPAGPAGATFPLVRYAYDAAGDLLAATNALGHAARFAYANHLLTRETFPSGLNFYFEYDGPGPGARCVHTWGDGGIYDTRLRYDTPHKTTVWNSYGHQKTYFHRNGLVRRLIDALGAEHRWDYNQYAELETTRDPLGHLTRYDYDGRGRQTSVTFPDGATTRTAYDVQGRPAQGTDANGGTWQWQYDAAGQLIAETDPAGATTRYAHDAQGRLTAVVNALGQTTRLRHDAQGSLAHIVAPDDGIRSRAYNALGHLVELTDARGHVERRQYDRLGQLIEVQAPEGTSRRFIYDASGNVVRVDDGRQPVEFVYTPMGQLAARRQAGQAVQFTYDREGKLTGVLNEHGEAYTFALDATGQVVEEVGFDGLISRYERDAAGRVTQVLRPGGRTTTYGYNGVGHMVEVVHNGTERTSYQYRADGELLEARTADSTVQFEHDPRGQVLREVQNGHEVCSSYNQIGQRVGVASSLGAAFSFERNTLGQVRRTQAGTWQSVVERDADGLELHRQLSGSLRTGWQRDALGRPISQSISVGNGAAHRRRYQWQGPDQLREIEDSQHGTSQYSYDDWGNLAGAAFPGQAPELRQPDAVGNLFRTRDRTDRRYGPGGQLQEANGTRYQYDEEGNLTRKTLPNGQQWHYAWDGAGQLAQVTRPDGYAVTFAYDALGRRISKRFRGRVTRWVWDGDKPLHEWTELEVGPGAGTAQDLATWLFEDDSFAPVAKLTMGQTFSVVSDHLGTPLSMYDGQGKHTWEMLLDSYGAVRQGKGKPQDCPFRYQGQYEDTETGLYYNRFRYYDPESGQYISQDPSRLAGGNALYSYVFNPTSWIDAFGLNGFNPITWPAPSAGTGNVYKVYQQPINWDLPVTGRGGITETNLQRALRGEAPFVQKGGRYSLVNLHHSKQNAQGPLFELSASTHSRYQGTNALHPHLPSQHPYNPVDRNAFNVDRGAYWQNRAQVELESKLPKSICH